MKKFTKVMSLVLAIFCISLCFAGCEIGASKTLKSINVASGTIKTTYNVGEQLDLTGAKLALNYSDKSKSEIAIDLNMVTGFDSSTAGEKILTITYKEKTTTVNYTVNEVNIPLSTTGFYRSDELPTTDPLSAGMQGQYINVAFDYNSTTDVYTMYFVSGDIQHQTKSDVVNDAGEDSTYNLTKELVNNKWQYKFVYSTNEGGEESLTVFDITATSIKLKLVLGGKVSLQTLNLY